MEGKSKRYSIPQIDDFILNLQTNNYSPETIYNYERDLRVFEYFLSELNLDFSRVDKSTIARYKAYLVSRDRKTPILALQQDKQLSSRSINRTLSSLRSFLKYLIEMDLPCPVPPEAVKLTKTERKHPRVAELHDLIRLIESPMTLEKDRKIGIRNRAMLEVLFSTGMRISELCSLNRDQIDKSGRIFITGKGRKQRFVYLTPRAQHWVEKCLAERKDTLPSLFVPTRGKNASSTKKRISTNYLQARIKLYRQKLGINVPTSAHSLRHGFATYLAEEGASPAAIQILLGHESLDTTTRYVHPSDKFAEETHKKFHPLAEPDEKT